jgi:CrcB protein
VAKLFWVCLGSAVGGGSRYLVSLWVLRWLGTGFPYGTFAVNVLGSLLLSVLMYVGTETTALGPTLRVALTTGVMGGFTTYSTFNHETLGYLQEGAWLLALGNVLATVLTCLVVAWAGWAVMRGWLGA